MSFQYRLTEPIGNASLEWQECSEDFYLHRANFPSIYEFRALYTAADYDKLRAEVERLTKLSDAISRDCNQTANERNEQRARAEAAEALVADLRAQVDDLVADRDSWECQASDRLLDWDNMRIRAESAESALNEGGETP